MRVVKQFDDRRREFFGLTKELFFSIGYEKMTIQMIIDRIGVAKGTFYHYFKSKEDLLVQWVIDEIEQAMPFFEKIVNDPHLDALGKLNTFFERGTAWKVEKIDMFVFLMKAMYADGNIRLRAEMTRQSILKTKKLYTQVIRQGVDEKLFNTPFSDDIASIILSLSETFSESLCRLLLAHYETRNASFEEALHLVAIWQDSIERILGTKRGALHLVDRDFLEKFFEYGINKQ